MSIHDWYIQKYSAGEVLVGEVVCPDCERTLERIRELKEKGDLSIVLKVVAPARAPQKERAAIIAAGVECI